MSILGIGPFKEGTVGNYTAGQAIDTGLKPEPGDVLYIQIGQSNNWGPWFSFDYAQWNALTSVAAGTVLTFPTSLRDQVIAATYDFAICKMNNGNVGLTTRTTDNLIDRVRVGGGGANAGQYNESSGIAALRS